MKRGTTRSTNRGLMGAPAISMCSSAGGDSGRIPISICGVILKTNGSWNWGKYSNPEFDQLLVAEQGETDDAKRIAIFRQIAELLTEDAPVIPYHFGANVKGLSPNVEGFVHRADGLVRYVDIGLRQ